MEKAFRRLAHLSLFAYKTAEFIGLLAQGLPHIACFRVFCFTSSTCDDSRMKPFFVNGQGLPHKPFWIKTLKNKGKTNGRVMKIVVFCSE
jgi:hypothetical protein